MSMSESEKLIRSLYEITNENHKGFPHQVSRLLRLGCDRFGVEIGILAKVEDQVYTVMHRFCPEHIPLNEGDSFELGETYCSVTLQANKPVFFEHIQTSEINKHPAYKKFALETYIGMPIRIGGRTYGTLNFSSPVKREMNFNEIDIDALRLMSMWISSELRHQESRRRMERANLQLKELAAKDSLTNIYNRRAFHNYLTQQIYLAKRLGNPLSLLMIDIDKFKKYNDTFGHLEGDKILSCMAELLNEHSRGSDIVARIGGEEFAVLLPNTDKAGALYLANSLHIAIHDYQWPKQAITASTGIATLILDSRNTEDVTELGNQIFKQADDAMYFSKKNGRNQINHFKDISEDSA